LHQTDLFAKSNSRKTQCILVNFIVYEKMQKDYQKSARNIRDAQLSCWWRVWLAIAALFSANNTGRVAVSSYRDIIRF